MGTTVDELALQRTVQEFVRAFGLLDPDQTPCGVPMPTSHAHALQLLGEPADWTQQALAGRLRLEKSTVSRIVSALVERGWVRRGESPASRREVRLALTTAGAAALEQVRAAAQAKYAAVLGRIPAAKRARVVDGLATLAAAMREE